MEKDMAGVDRRPPIGSLGEVEIASLPPTHQTHTHTLYFQTVDIKYTPKSLVSFVLFFTVTVARAASWCSGAWEVANHPSTTINPRA